MSSRALHFTFTQQQRHWEAPAPLTKPIWPHFPFAHYTPATVASFLFQEPAVPLPWNVLTPSLYLTIQPVALSSVMTSSARSPPPTSATTLDKSLG